MKKFFIFLLVIGFLVGGYSAYATLTDTYTPVQVEGDGSDTTFDFDFRVYATSDVSVYLIDENDESRELQVETTDYTVTLSTTTDGGTITFGTAPGTDKIVYIGRSVPYTQTVDIPAGGLFREQHIETALDKNVVLIQQLHEEVSRALKAPIGTAEEDVPDYAEIIDEAAAGAVSSAAAASDSADAAAASAASASDYASTAGAAAVSAANSANDAADSAAAAAEAALGEVKAEQADSEGATNDSKFMTPLQVYYETRYPGALDIPSDNINWTSFEADIQAGAINWSSLNKNIGAEDINWATLNDNVQAAGINWTTLNDDIQSAGINWANVQVTDLSRGPQRWAFTVGNPSLWYSGTDHEILLEPSTACALTVTSINCSCNADPTTEITGDLKFADSFIGLANATVIDAIDTTNGATSITSSFDDATVPSGKAVYLSFDTTPDSALLQFSCSVRWSCD